MNQNLPDVTKESIRRVIRYAIIIFLFLLVVGWLPRHLRYNQSKADAEALGSVAISVNVVSPKAAAAVGSITLPGDVDALQSTLLFPRANGYLKTLLVDLGDTVEPGQLLAEIDTPEIDAQYAQAKAQLEKAKSDLELQTITFNRYKPLKLAGGISQQDLDEKQAALKSTQAQIEDARANVDHLAALKGFEKITAPFSGIITERNFDIGALMNSAGGSKALFKIDRIDTVRVFINVPQAQVGGIALGQNASLHVANFAKREFVGHISKISGGIDSVSRTMKVQVDIANQDRALTVGMYGDVTLAINQSAPITIPTSALVFDAEGTRAAVVSGDTVHFKKLVLGKDFGADVEVLSGLEVSDQVVANPGQKTVEGAVVTVVKPG